VLVGAIADLDFLDLVGCSVPGLLSFRGPVASFFVARHHSTRSFAIASEMLSHYILSGLSDPPCFSAFT
jgi:hypothetical protein